MRSEAVLAAPVVRAWPDLGTPRDAFARVRDLPGAFLLESAATHAGSGRWSYVGASPAATLTADARGARLTTPDGHVIEAWNDAFAAIDALERRLRAERGARPNDLGFAGGLVGFLSYDLARRVERVPSRVPADPDLPEATLHVVDRVLAHDALTGRWYGARLDVSALAPPGRAWDDADALLARAPRRAGAFHARPVTSNTGRDEYERRVRRVLEYVRAGDVFQVNLSRRLESLVRGDPFALYERAATLSPAPFAAYLEFPAFTLAGASPERFLRVRDGRVQARPIKGTRPRSTLEPDSNAALLAASEKDRAENLMIADLIRNDLGRVCRYGTVRATRLFDVEAHGPVWQMVSTVEGELRDDATVAALLRAAWPPGSMTGAPKVRAMQVIEELEAVRRGPYAGAVGYIDASGDADLAVTIRTALVVGGRAFVQVGGGIVADSDPAAEYRETEWKAAAWRRALGA